MDSRINPTVLQAVIESLCFRLIVHDKEKFSKESVSELAYCLKNHVTIEWKLMKLFGVSLGLNLISLVNLKKNIEKNLKWSN